MPRIFDNIDEHLLPALAQTWAVSKRADCCMGYFNLRGWKKLDTLEQWPGGEDHCCRLMVGIQRTPQDELHEVFRLGDAEDGIDNPQAIRLKRKQAEQKRFLSWLGGVLKISADRQGNTGLDAPTGKSRPRNYLGDYQKGEPELPYEELEDILFKNRTRLGVSLSDTHFIARLRAEHNKSLVALQPIKAQLARTDALIDQVVYRLYGLSEDEVAIVEGKR